VMMMMMMMITVVTILIAVAFMTCQSVRLVPAFYIHNAIRQKVLFPVPVSPSFLSFQFRPFSVSVYLCFFISGSGNNTLLTYVR